MNVNPLFLTDFYKISHYFMYPEGMTQLYSNLTPRKSRMAGVNEVVVFGFQYMIKEYLIKQWNENFFNRPKEVVMVEYSRFMKNTIGGLNEFHVAELHDLGYLPIKIKALPEGSHCPIGIPCMTITNTHEKFAWLVNYLETLMSAVVWQPITSATIADQYRLLLEKHALKTTGNVEGVQWQGHDFSFRGMSSIEAAMTSGAAHLLSFTGTDTIPAINFLEEYYNANIESELVGASVPATEHSVMCMGEKETEIETFRKLLRLYPSGILSVVSDTWNLWDVITKYLPELKEEILSRDGKLVIRPDSGDPVDIICGKDKAFEDVSKSFIEQDEYLAGDFEDLLLDEVRDFTPHGEHGPIEHTGYYKIDGKYFEVTIHNISWNRHDKQYYYIDMWDEAKITLKEVKVTPEIKGVIELLWDVFGGTINEQGYKVLDSHIGAIYGDSITLERANEICERLAKKGFASTNIVLGVGSFTYQYNTRDTFGFAVKATYGEVLEFQGNEMQTDGDETKAYIAVGREIFKDPITDDGTKKSKKGLLFVQKSPIGKYEVIDQVSKEVEEKGELEVVFENSKIVKEWSLQQVRDNIRK